MRYFNRYFDFCQYESPNGYLDYFRADEHAKEYNEEFYLKIYNMRGENIFSDVNTSTRLLAYNIIPDEIKGKIADIRLFFIGIISPSVYLLMHLYFECDYIKTNQVIEQFRKKNEEDIKIVPAHLKEFFEKSWHDYFIEQFQFIHNDFKFVSHGQDADYNITMKNAKVTINDGTLHSGRIEWYEIFYNNPGVELNFITFFSDMSIEADDVEFVEHCIS